MIVVDAPVPVPTIWWSCLTTSPNMVLTLPLCVDVCCFYPNCPVASHETIFLVLVLFSDYAHLHAYIHACIYTYMQCINPHCKPAHTYFPNSHVDSDSKPLDHLHLFPSPPGVSVVSPNSAPQPVAPRGHALDSCWDFSVINPSQTQGSGTHRKTTIILDDSSGMIESTTDWTLKLLPLRLSLKLRTLLCQFYMECLSVTFHGKSWRWGFHNLRRLCQNVFNKYLCPHTNPYVWVLKNTQSIYVPTYLPTSYRPTYLYRKLCLFLFLSIISWAIIIYTYLSLPMLIYHNLSLSIIIYRYWSLSIMIYHY